MPRDDVSYRATLDQLVQGFQLVGPDWTYRYVNPSAARQGRSTPEALEGKKMWEAYPGIEHTPLFALLKRCMEQGGTASFENRFTFPDGSTRWYELRIEPAAGGICIHSVDIQERKDAEDALRALNEDLERQVALRTSELVLANRDLEAFAYSVSNDLRSPLRGIDGFAEALDDDFGPALGSIGHQYLGRIRAAAQRMGHLIDDLLYFSRIGRAGMRRSTVDVSELVRNVLAEFHHREPERVIESRIEPDLSLDADLALLRIVVENLVANAWKFSKNARAALIEFGSTIIDGEAVLFVRDNGAGFDMRHAERLFRPFERLHTAAEYAGTGVGLATVQRIVERHGGRIWPDATVGSGATFYFTIPSALD